jgi:hypothetical protein
MSTYVQVSVRTAATARSCWVHAPVTGGLVAVAQRPGDERAQPDDDPQRDELADLHPKFSGRPRKPRTPTYTNLSAMTTSTTVALGFQPAMVATSSVKEWPAMNAETSFAARRQLPASSRPRR